MRKFVLLLIVAMLSFGFVSQAKAVDSMGADEDQVTANQMADYKEDVNKAIADLNSKIQAVDAKVDKGATVSGRAYIAYESWLKNAGAAPTIYNKFAIHRVYLDYKKSLADDAAVRITTDMGNESTLSAQNNIYLKYAYFDLSNFSKHVPLTSLIGLQTVRLGQSATHWIDFMQEFWTFRYVEKTLTDYYSFFGSGSADLGLAALGSFNLLGNALDYHFTLMNGADYKSAETNTSKNIALKIKAQPFAWDKNKVTVAAGYVYEGLDLSSFNTGTATKKLTAMAALNFARGILFAEYANNADSSTTPGGTSVGGQYELVGNTNLFGRLDNYKKSGSNYVYTIAGLEYNWGKNVKLALDYRNETKDGADYNNVMAVNTRVKW